MEAMRHYPAAGGKRLRPVMALTACAAVGGDEERAMPFALALEMTHNFTLIHDDLMDKDAVRRGRPAVHIIYDEATAINAGDAMFARSFYLLTKLDVPDPVLRTILEDFSMMVQGIAEGQQMDMDFESRREVTEEEYMVMVEKKTALMFKTAAKGGALIGRGTEEEISALDEYGRLLGIGFQIWDDLLDLQADEKVLGKPVGSDIKNGKKTLAAVWALNHLEGEQREAFLRAFGNAEADEETVAKAIEAMREGGAIEYATRRAEEYAEKSRRLLGVLRDGPDKEILLAAVDFMVKREK